ncbi:hypothetical protein Q3G72_020130 [Acer saccharum]|nr:hypothetical protein Q3G72_020130 [Acer saccharum]
MTTWTSSLVSLKISSRKRRKGKRVGIKKKSLARDASAGKNQRSRRKELAEFTATSDSWKSARLAACMNSQESFKIRREFRSASNSRWTEESKPVEDSRELFAT